MKWKNNQVIDHETREDEFTLSSASNVTATNILSFSVEQFRTPHVVYNSISASLFFLLLLLSNQPTSRPREHDTKITRRNTFVPVPRSCHYREKFLSVSFA